MSNASVAKLLNADVVLVANGGIGSAFDELDLNRISLMAAGARLKGVIINKVVPDKVDMVREYIGRAMRERWGVPLLGVVPDLPFLSKATLGDLEKVKKERAQFRLAARARARAPRSPPGARLRYPRRESPRDPPAAPSQMLHGELIAGYQCRGLHYGAGDVTAVTTGVRRFLRKTRHRQRHANERRPLFVTHCTRDDIVLGYLAHYHQNKNEIDVRRAAFGRGARVSQSWLGALIISRGSAEGVVDDDDTPLPYLVEIAKAHDAPIMVAPGGTTEVADSVERFTAKLHINDPLRVAAAIGHYEPHIDFDTLLAP